MAQKLGKSSVVLHDDKIDQNTAIEAKSDSSLINVDLKDPEKLEGSQSQQNGSNNPQINRQVYDFEIKVASPGNTATVNVYFDEPISEDYVWTKYDASSGWSEYTNAEFSQDRKKVTLTLVDGGAGDQDGKENGVIVDPSGPALTTELNDESQDPVNDSDGTGGGCSFTASSGFGLGWSLLLLLPVLIAIRRAVGIRKLRNEITQ